MSNMVVGTVLLPGRSSSRYPHHGWVDGNVVYCSNVSNSSGSIGSNVGNLSIQSFVVSDSSFAFHSVGCISADMEV